MRDNNGFLRIRKGKKSLSIKQIFEELGLVKHTLYEVEVSWGSTNPSHQAFLFVGFETGGYCEIYTNNYDTPMKLQDAFKIKIVSKLAKID